MTYKEAYDDITYAQYGGMSRELKKVLVEALEKQIPKKPRIETIVAICPRCSKAIIVMWDYCQGCGQALDWSEGESDD